MTTTCPVCGDHCEVKGAFIACESCHTVSDTPRHLNDSAHPWEILGLVVGLLAVLVLNLLNSWR